MADRPDESRTLHAAGAGPFVTRRVYHDAHAVRAVWRSREHRKGLAPAEHLPLKALHRHAARGLVRVDTLNWWIAAGFAVGSLLFALGCLPQLTPALARSLGLNAASANPVFFAGSIFFTAAAGLQLHQAANAGEFTPDGPRRPPHRVVFGWRPHDAGWLSCALQFPGTLLFNLNTLDALRPGLTPLGQDLGIWVPDMLGSVLFLASGALAYVEICHAWLAWRPANLSWWIAAANLAGCVAFMISAVYAFVPLAPDAAGHALLATGFTFLGALGFLAGSLLMFPENAPAAQVAAPAP